MRKGVYNMPMLWEDTGTKNNNIFNAPVKTMRNKDIKVKISREIEKNCVVAIDDAIIAMTKDITNSIMKGLYNGRR